MPSTRVGQSQSKSLSEERLCLRSHVVGAFENKFGSGFTSRINGKAKEYFDLKGRSLIGSERKSYGGSLSLKKD